MGCLLGLAALLALAIPASIAPASLVGAYVVLAVLVGMAFAATSWNTRHRRKPSADLPFVMSRPIVGLVVLTVVYAGAIALIHAAT